MATEPTPTPRTSALAFAGWLALSFLAASMGGLFPPGAWYANLQKPAWNPPGWVFGPVWTTLYTLMAVAAWWVWRQGGFARQGRALRFYLAQLSFNALWSPLFFGFHQPAWALLDLVLLWISLVATIQAFRKTSLGAALLLVPYLVWVSFAGVLNYTLWQLNRSP